MNGFEPGEGWRKLLDGEPIRGEYLHHGADEEDAGEFWVREKPVPPLPTEPYTVIRTGPMRWMKCGLYFHPNGTEGNRNAWMLLVHESQTERRAITAAGLQVQCVYDVKSVREQVSEFGFEVLTEPIAREFGVQA